VLYDSSLPFDFSDFFCFAEKMCLVDGKQSFAVPIIAEDQELVHFNSLWCRCFMNHPCLLIFLTFFVLQRRYALSMASSLFAVPIIAEDQELVHFISLWCRCFMNHPCLLIFLTFFVLQRRYALSMASSPLQRQFSMSLTP
jgi:hypothetical protein